MLRYFLSLALRYFEQPRVALGWKKMAMNKEAKKAWEKHIWVSVIDKSMILLGLVIRFLTFSLADLFSGPCDYSFAFFLDLLHKTMCLTKSCFCLDAFKVWYYPSWCMLWKLSDKEDEGLKDILQAYHCLLRRFNASPSNLLSQLLVWITKMGGKAHINIKPILCTTPWITISKSYVKL